MKLPIFISYSRTDLQKVTSIKEEIEKTTGLLCWMDLTGIESGTMQFLTEIVDGIDDAQLFLFMLSENSQNSRYALGELNYAYQQSMETDKHVVMLNIDGCKMKREFYVLYGLTDIIDWQNTPQREKFYTDLRKWFSNSKSKKEDDEVLFASQNPEDLDYWGFVNKEGKEILPYLWKRAESFKNGFGLVMDEKLKWGMIDKNGNLKVPCKWHKIKHLSEGFAAVTDGKKWGFIDKDGQLAIPLAWRDAGSFSDGLAPVLNNKGKYGFINKRGCMVIPFDWVAATDFSEGLAAVTNTRGLTGYISTEGNLKIHYQWHEATLFLDGYARVGKYEGEDILYQVINKKGQIVSSKKYKDIEWFWNQDGLCAVEDINGNWGYINRAGKEIIPCIWKEAREFEDGLGVVVNQDGKWGVLDPTGKEIIACKYNYIYYSSSRGNNTITVEDPELGIITIDKPIK